MNSLYSVEQDKNKWDYSSDVGIISKITIGSDYDAVQDQNIQSNKDQIQETKQSLIENENRDDAQQAQLDANDILDKEQQEQINSNKEAIERNEERDNEQQTQIDDTINRLNQNISDDERQQSEIDANKSEISRLDGEMPTLTLDGTTLIIGKRGDL